MQAIHRIHAVVASFIMASSIMTVASAAPASKTPTPATRECMKQFIASGKQAGKILFQEDFSDPAQIQKRWTFNRDTKIIPDGRNGHSLLITPIPKHFAQIVLKVNAFIPVDAAHPIVVFWEAKAAKDGNPARLRLDFYDQAKKSLSANQLRSTTDKKQPGVFHRNAFYVNQWMPENTAFMRLSFHQSPMPHDKKPAEITAIKVVDLAQP